MIELRQLVEEQKWNGMTDVGVIKTFFALNDMEEEGMDLIYELTKSKVGKLKREQGIVKTWASALPSDGVTSQITTGTLPFSFSSMVR